MLLDSWQNMPPGAPDAEQAAALLPELKVLRFSGSDVLGFLQGYLTIDTADLPQGAVRLTALTNLQGRVVANGWCASPQPDVLEWTVHESLTDHVAGFLRRYLAFSRTRLEVRVDDHLVLDQGELDLLDQARDLVPKGPGPAVDIRRAREQDGRNRT